MRTSLLGIALSLSALVTLTHTQTQASLPSCATSCVAQFTSGSSIDGCNSADVACICSDGAFLNNVACCTASTCDTADQEATVQYAQQVCEAAGVALSAVVPGGTQCATTSTTSSVSTTTSAAALTSSLPPVSTSSIPSSSSSSSLTAISSSSPTSISSSSPTSISSFSSSSTSSIDSSTTSATSSTPSAAISGKSTTTSSPASATISGAANVQHSSEGLSNGAKAGIGVGVALLSIIIICGLLFWFRRQKKQNGEKRQHDLETSEALSSARGHELISPANAHELNAKGAAGIIKPITHDSDAKKERLDSKHVAATVGEADSAVARLTGRKGVASEMQTPSNTHELPRNQILPPEMHTPSNTHELPTATNVGSDWEHFQPSELEGKKTYSPDSEMGSPASPTSPARKPVRTSTQNTVDGSLASSSQPLAAGEPRSNEDRLEILRQRIDRVREDKERLEKIQQLKDLEAELKREIMLEQGKAGGT